MTEKKTPDSLDKVYGAKGTADVARTYDDWAAGYDTEMLALGYRHPSVCLSLLCRHLPKGDGPILDAGAGTGMLGEWMETLGYPACEALDISDRMLDIARKKKVYTALHKAALGEPLDFADGHFAAIVSAGVFTTGHVGPEAFPELIRITRPGGILVLTIKDTMWFGETGAALHALVADGTWQIIDETAPYVSMPGRPDTVPGRAVVLKLKPA